MSVFIPDILHPSGWSVIRLSVFIQLSEPDDVDEMLLSVMPTLCYCLDTFCYQD